MRAIPGYTTAVCEAGAPCNVTTIRLSQRQRGKHGPQPGRGAKPPTPHRQAHASRTLACTGSPVGKPCIQSISAVRTDTSALLPVLRDTRTTQNCACLAPPSNPSHVRTLGRSPPTDCRTPHAPHAEPLLPRSPSFVPLTAALHCCLYPYFTPSTPRPLARPPAPAPTPPPPPGRTAPC